MTLQSQVKLLQVLQEQTITRVGSTKLKKIIIAPTNQNLQNLEKFEGFKENLLYRINVVLIVVPPLRERN